MFVICIRELLLLTATNGNRYYRWRFWFWQPRQPDCDDVYIDNNYHVENKRNKIVRKVLDRKTVRANRMEQQQNINGFRFLKSFGNVDCCFGS